LTTGVDSSRLEALVAGVASGERTALARAITIIESSRPADRALADALLQALLPRTGGAMRVGITGVPGVGKSTFIDALGSRLVQEGKRVAVLAVDPSSTVSGGSILGDKSRMHRLARDERAFIRPSPSSGTLGGVARRTRESMLLCEAAGFDVVVVETVGVGQSETVVSEMVDCFVLLALPGAGDELQGIKRGVVELADLVAVNKADGDNLERANLAVHALRAALRYLRPAHASWTPKVVAISAMTGTGLDELWTEIQAQRAALDGSGELAGLRQEQKVRWMWTEIENGLHRAFAENPTVAARLPELEAAVRTGTATPSAAAQALLASFRGGDAEPEK